MKASCELWNFRRALDNHRLLLFSRRQVLRVARRDASGALWDDFFEKSEALLNGRLELRDITSYIPVAHSFLSATYVEYHNTIDALLNGDAGLVHKLHQLFETVPHRPQPEFAPVELGGLPDLSQDTDDRVVGVLVSPQPVQFHPSKVLVVVVLELLGDPPLTSIDTIRDRIAENLEHQGVGWSEIEFLLVDYKGYLCFGVPATLGENARLLVDRRPIGPTSLSDRLCYRDRQLHKLAASPVLHHLVDEIKAY